MLPSDFHGLFEATSEVAGTLIGLLFVAISVAGDRITGDHDESHGHRVRAQAAFTAFINALAVSLFALVPRLGPGGPAAVTGAVGVMIVIGLLLSLVRVQQSWSGHRRDAFFLVGLGVLFALEVVAGLHQRAHPGHVGPNEMLAILVIVCFLFGIARSWELIGGPRIGLSRELGKRRRVRTIEILVDDDGTQSA